MAYTPPIVNASSVNTQRITVQLLFFRLSFTSREPDEEQIINDFSRLLQILIRF
jgi:hypothetical protein